MKNYLKVIEAVGKILIEKDIEIDLLKYENEKLKKFKTECEELNK